MAKAPKTPHARAIGALINLKITPAEYRECLRGGAWVKGGFFTRRYFGGLRRVFGLSKPITEHHRLPTPGALDLRRAKGVM